MHAPSSQSVARTFINIQFLALTTTTQSAIERLFNIANCLRLHREQESLRSVDRKIRGVHVLCREVRKVSKEVYAFLGKSNANMGLSSHRLRRSRGIVKIAYPERGHESFWLQWRERSVLLETGSWPDRVPERTAAPGWRNESGNRARLRNPIDLLDQPVLLYLLYMTHSSDEHRRIMTLT